MQFQLSLETTERSWLVATDGTDGIVHSNRPLRIGSVDGHNFYVAAACNTRQNPVLTFNRQASTSFVLRHYKRQQRSCLLYNQDVVQVVLEAPKRYLHCAEVHELLEAPTSSKDLESSSVRLINDSYFQRENHRVQIFQPETEEDCDRLSFGLLNGSYWRMCLPDCTTSEPLKCEQGVRLRSLTSGLFLTRSGSEDFGLSKHMSSASLFKFSQLEKRYDDESGGYTQSIFYDEQVALDSELNLQLVAVRTNGFLQNLCVENLQGFFLAAERLEMDTRSKLHPSEMFAALNEQAHQFKRFCNLFQQIYEGLVRELWSGLAIERTFFFKKALEIMSILNKKLRSRSYLELKSNHQEPVMRLLGGIEQTVSGLMEQCFQFLVSILRQQRAPTEDLPLFYETIMDFDGAHSEYVLVALELAVACDSKNLYAKELWGMNLLGSEEQQALSYSTLRVVRWVLQATLDRAPTCDYLSRGIHCQLVVSEGQLALFFEGSPPVHLNSLSETESLEAYECLRLIALNGSSRTIETVQELLNQHPLIFMQFILSNANLQLKTGIMSILQYHTRHDEIDTTKCFVFALEKSRLQTVRSLITGKPGSKNLARRELIAVLMELDLRNSPQIDALEMLEVIVMMVRGYANSGDYAVADVQTLEETVIDLCRMCLITTDDSSPTALAKGTAELKRNILARIERELQLLLDGFANIRQKAMSVRRFDREWAQRCLESYYELLSHASGWKPILRSLVGLLLQSYRDLDEEKSELILVGKQSPADEFLLAQVETEAKSLMQLLEQLPDLMYMQKNSTENDLQQSISSGFSRLTSLLATITATVDQRDGSLSALKELQYVLHAKDIHLRLVSLIVAGTDQIDSGFFQPLLSFLELFVRHNEINARALLREGISWRAFSNQKLLCSLHRFCSLTELENTLEQFIDMPLNGVCSIMMALHQEFMHSPKSVQDKHELSIFLVEAVLERDPDFRGVKAHCANFDTHLNPSMVSQPQMEALEAEAVLYLLAQITTHDATIRDYVQQRFPIEVLLAHAKDESFSLAKRKPYLSLLAGLLEEKQSTLLARVLSSYLETIDIGTLREEVDAAIRRNAEVAQNPPSNGLSRKVLCNAQFWRFKVAEELSCYVCGELTFISRLLSKITRNQGILLPLAARKLTQLLTVYNLVLDKSPVTIPYFQDFFVAVQDLALEMLEHNLISLQSLTKLDEDRTTLGTLLEDFRKLEVDLRLIEESQPDQVASSEDIEIELSLNHLKHPDSPVERQPQKPQDGWKKLFNLEEYRGRLSFGEWQRLERLAIRLSYQAANGSNLLDLVPSKTQMRLPTFATFATTMGLTWSEETLKNINSTIASEQLQKSFNYACVLAVVQVLDFNRLSHLLLAGKLLKNARVGTAEEHKQLLVKLWNRLLDVRQCRSSLNYGTRVKLLIAVRRRAVELSMGELAPLTEFIRGIQDHLKADFRVNAELITSSADLCAIDSRSSNRKGEFDSMEFVKELAVRMYNDNCSGSQLIMNILKSELKESDDACRRQLLERSSTTATLCEIMARMCAEGLQLLAIEEDRLKLLFDTLDFVLESALIVQSDTFRESTRLEYLRHLATIEHQLVKSSEDLGVSLGTLTTRKEYVTTSVLLHIRTIINMLISPSQGYLLENIRKKLAEQAAVDDKIVQTIAKKQHSVQVVLNQHILTVFYVAGKLEMSEQLAEQISLIMKEGVSTHRQLTLELMDTAAVCCEVVGELNERTDLLRRWIESHQKLILASHLLLVFLAVLNGLLIGPVWIGLLLLVASFIVNLTTTGAKFQMLLTNRRILQRMKRKSRVWLPFFELCCILMNGICLYRPNYCGLLLAALLLESQLRSKLLSFYKRISDWPITGFMLYWCFWNMLLFVIFYQYNKRDFFQEMLRFMNYLRHPYEYPSDNFSFVEWSRRTLDSLVLNWLIPTMLMAVLIEWLLSHREMANGGKCCMCQTRHQTCQDLKKQQSLKRNIPHYVQFFSCLLAKTQTFSDFEHRIREAVLNRDSSIMPE